jgi:hypothetical protein
MSTSSFTFLFPDTNSKSLILPRLISVSFLGLINLPSHVAVDTSCSGELLSFCLSCPWALISSRFEAKYLSNSLMQSSCCQNQHENTSQSISRPIFASLQHISPKSIPQDEYFTSSKDLSSHFLIFEFYLGLTLTLGFQASRKRRLLITSLSSPIATCSLRLDNDILPSANPLPKSLQRSSP